MTKKAAKIVFVTGPMMGPNFMDALGRPQAPPRVSRTLCTRLRDAFRHEAREFCLLTGLHGYKYIVQPGKHKVERLFWTAMVSLSMAAALWMMVNAYIFNSSHPTILAVDSTHYPLAQVEAPSVTVCPSNKVLRSRAQRLVRSMVLPAGMTEEQAVHDMGMLIELVSNGAVNATHYMRLHRILHENSLSVDHVMRLVTPTCDEMLERCSWKRRQCYHCSDLFRQVRTAYGYCCSFNYVDRDIEKYKPKIGGCVGVAYQTVQRLSACGYTNGLSVVVRIRRDEFLSSFLSSHAAMVLIHNPLQYPDANSDLKVVGAGTVSFLSYTAQVTTATGSLRRLPPAVRKCRFSDETFLPMFTSYTFENCWASCFANWSLTECGCVPFTFPHIAERRICNLADTPCVSAVMSKRSANRNEVANAKRMCPLCEPLCSNVEYAVETSVGNLDWNEALDVEPLIENLTGSQDDYALFHVFASDLVTTRYKMNVFKTNGDLLGSLGGLSGLFVGFSLVSGFELVYFFTIRPFFRMRARNAASLANSRGATSHRALTAGAARPGPPPPHPTSVIFPLAGPQVFRFRRHSKQGGTETHDERGERPLRSNESSNRMFPVIEYCYTFM